MNFEERLKQYIEEDKIYQDFKEHKNLNIPTDFDMFCIQHCEDIEAILKQNAELKERYNNMFECHCNRVEAEKLQNNWNELYKWLADYGKTKDILVPVAIVKIKMDELRNTNNE